ncbi:hypothetical protein [Companilactobacillus kimchiensis]|nr:hypothetical protein [Companilactobacillus kimchiensis]
MFAYIQIIDNKSAVSYGYTSFSFSNCHLSIAKLEGMINSTMIEIPISQIADPKRDTYYRWNRIQFNYNNKHYIFLYTTTRESEYFQKNLPNLTVA